MNLDSKFLERFTKPQKTVVLSVALFVLMIVVAVFSEEGFMTVYEFEAELENLTQQNAKLAQKNNKLKQEIHSLKNDPFAVEKIAREKLNLVKPGERVYQIVYKEHVPQKSHAKP